MLAAAFAVLALTMLMLLALSRRALRLKKENSAADDALGEALAELEMENSPSRPGKNPSVNISLLKRSFM